MAAITPDATYKHNCGSNTLLQAVFSAGTADDGDSWASGLSTRVLGFWSQDEDNPTVQTAVGVAVVNSSGTFTFYPAEDNKPFTLYVLIDGA